MDFGFENIPSGNPSIYIQKGFSQSCQIFLGQYTKLGKIFQMNAKNFQMGKGVK
jgi:hypothetical protein